MMSRDDAAAAAYALDCARRPVYHNGQPRRAWSELCDMARESWRRDPTPRDWPARELSA